MISNQYPPYHRGGDAIQCQILSEGLVKRGYQVSVIYDPYSYEYFTHKKIKEKYHDIQSGVEIYPIRSNPFSFLLSYLGIKRINGRLLKLLSNLNPDIIHFHNSSAFGWTAFSIAGRINKKILMTAHDTWIICPLRKIILSSCNDCFICQIKDNRIPNIRRQNEIKYINKIIFPSLFIKNLIVNRYPFLNYSIIPNGITKMDRIQDFDELIRIRQKYDIPNKRIGIFVGILKKEKGYLDVIQAIKRIKKVFIIFIGENQEQIFPDSDSGKIMGFIKDKKTINELYSIANFFIMPSYNENSPLVILEAMSKGLPIISSKMGGIPEIVTSGKEGILIEPGNHSQLNLAINTLINNDELIQTMGKAGITKFQSCFSTEIMINKYIEIYDQV
jgi:glycosyltransferase involved in cell wall biosynthesis